MSELLEMMPSCLSAALEASQKLRAYVEDIDRFLSPAQTPEPPPPDFNPSQNEIYVTTEDDFSDIVIPAELLERIPWDWTELYQTF